MKKTDPCPCGSGSCYADCCQRFWATQQKPSTAEQLMRSRYTAFVLEKAQYLVDTHHPDYRAEGELTALKKSFKGMKWLGLEIVQTSAGLATDTEGKVEFIARCQHLGKAAHIHEHSRFCQENGQWFYMDIAILNNH